MQQENIYKRICKLRDELEAAVRKGYEEKDPCNENILAVSRKMDELITEYLKKELRKAK